MRIIISPAKKMNEEPDLLAAETMPVFLEDTKILMEWMQGLSYEEAKALWKCNDKLAKLNYDRFRRMDLLHNLTPALISYEGIQYQYMAPDVFTQEELDYVREHLRILSGFYGVLRPMDGVTPYRLEMQAKAEVSGKKNLYDFWGDRICQAVTDGDEERVILNLASKEYSKCVEANLQPEDTFITCVFGEMIGDRVIQKGTQAKMARGEMVRYMAEHRIIRPEEIHGFDRLGYRFHPELSSEKEYIFLQENILS
ncbi:MAG: peroxide stress protein YaaA [Clostridiales bacterium]|nr:peroxide stress protein YaaA [Clostridiales bacterium]